MNDFWNDFRRNLAMAASASMFYVAIDYENEPVSNVNIKIHHCFLNSGFLVSA